jgi:hypothetical protein
MSILNLYRVEFEITKPAPAPPIGGSGKAALYRRGARQALVSASSGHPRDILSVLNSDVTLNAGEQIEILSVSQVVGGSEGSGVLA